MAAQGSRPTAIAEILYATPMTPDVLLDLARQALDTEARALHELRARLDGEAGVAFTRAVQAVLACKGRVAVMGMGKSGHVGRKIAATLASTDRKSVV